MDDHDENDNSHPKETNRRPGKEAMGSQRPHTSRTTCSTRLLRRSEGAYDPTRYVLLVELENRELRQRLAEANRQNAE
uniref:Uncharacterized protein n=1 Tax=Cannabis sativa TaxID=3483 RepID=A0A803P4C7_CANSA